MCYVIRDRRAVGISALLNADSILVSRLHTQVDERMSFQLPKYRSCDDAPSPSQVTYAPGSLKLLSRDAWLPCRNHRTVQLTSLFEVDLNSTESLTL